MTESDRLDSEIATLRARYETQATAMLDVIRERDFAEQRADEERERRKATERERDAHRDHATAMERARDVLAAERDTLRAWVAKVTGERDALREQLAAAQGNASLAKIEQRHATDALRAQLAEARAREILKPFIWENEFYHDSTWNNLRKLDADKITLAHLEAIAWWMRNKA